VSENRILQTVFKSKRKAVENCTLKRIIIHTLDLVIFGLSNQG
jgi:hypothetical protein